MIAVDFVFIGVVVLAGMIAMGLGVVRVVLGLGGWVGAGLVTLYGFHFVRPFAHRWIETNVLADAAAGGALFVGSLIVLTLITHAIAHRVHKSGLGALDRTLGLVAGLTLGAIIVCSAFIIVERVMQWSPDPQKRPEWVREARSVKVVEAGADLLISFVPREWGGYRRPESPKSGDSSGAARKLMTPEAKGAAPSEKSGYDTRERREMDRLIQSNQ